MHAEYCCNKQAVTDIQYTRWKEEAILAVLIQNHDRMTGTFATSEREVLLNITQSDVYRRPDDPRDPS
jgi:hypothetical protein